MSAAVDPALVSKVEAFEERMDNLEERAASEPRADILREVNEILSEIRELRASLR